MFLDYIEVRFQIVQSSSTVVFVTARGQSKSKDLGVEFCLLFTVQAWLPVERNTVCILHQKPSDLMELTSGDNGHVIKKLSVPVDVSGIHVKFLL